MGTDNPVARIQAPRSGRDVNRYAFYLDSAACSGCKACQAACKDRHSLTPGVLWRRVYEVSGGSWTQRGEAWTSTVFAYNLSLGCNHCDRPICMEVCPSAAFSKRADGVVLLDSDKCIGCQYCTWACPYGAPQYDERAGTTGKCDFCIDDLGAGLSPACVAACPIRVLQFGEKDELIARLKGAGQVFPLPDPEQTRPALLIAPHPAASHAAALAGHVANHEEVEPARGRHDDAPLVAFTLLSQAAAGAFWAMLVLALLIPASPAPSAVYSFALAAPVLACLLMLAALAVSTGHLGVPARAWRAIANLRTSWLSREVLLALIFTACSALYAVLKWLQPAAAETALLAQSFLAFLGLALVYAMARVYRLRTLRQWDTRWTPISSVLTALALGGAVAGLALTPAVLLQVEWAGSAVRVMAGWAALAMGLQVVLPSRLLSAAEAEDSPSRLAVSSTALRLRVAAILANLIALMLIADPGIPILQAVGFWILSILIVSTQIRLRRMFYQSRTPPLSR